MLRRSFATLGFIALTLGACHSNGPPGNSMPDNPMYPGGMNYRVGSAARGNHSATRDATTACTSAAVRATASGCGVAQ